jgi:hypothetical protein
MSSSSTTGPVFPNIRCRPPIDSSSKRNAIEISEGSVYRLVPPRILGEVTTTRRGNTTKQRSTLYTHHHSHSLRLQSRRAKGLPPREEELSFRSTVVADKSKAASQFQGKGYQDDSLPVNKPSTSLIQQEQTLYLGEDLQYLDDQHKSVRISAPTGGRLIIAPAHLERTAPDSTRPGRDIRQTWTLGPLHTVEFRSDIHKVDQKGNITETNSLVLGPKSDYTQVSFQQGKFQYVPEAMKSVFDGLETLTVQDDEENEMDTD